MVFLFMAMPLRGHAQTSDSIRLPIDSTEVCRDTSYGIISPHELLVTFDKTTHLIFPSAIRYVDLGSENITAGKAEDAENVLRVKAAVKDFTEGTNFSVITEDGRFYNFNVWYSEYPDVLTFNFASGTGLKASYPDQDTDGSILFNELGTQRASVPELVMKTVYKKNKRVFRHIGSQSFGIQVLLKGIYTLDGKLYFHLSFRNVTYIPFTIDFISFKVVDKKIAKRTVIQERTIVPLREYLSLNQVDGSSLERNIYLLEQMTIPDDKLLIIEIFEKNGGRHQVLKIENSDLVKARPVKEMYLDFNSK
ncbi:conjugative transposon protein TraN [Chryseobacterium sp. CF314]|uniref:Conjugative transposon TraN protein n=2 Tax=Chryseobacterium populi TaxID=1144316 RepID=J3CMA4_9FLAO|nr:conjugative transposon TraN protein [Chryseobacterium populi]